MEATDQGLLYFIGSRQRPWLNELMLAMTPLGSLLVLLPVAILAALGFLIARKHRAAVVMALTEPASLALQWTLKPLINRDRPRVTWRLIDLPAGPSFPSGHALGSMAVFGALTLILLPWIQPRWARWLVAIIGFALPILIGASRPYLGVHYPADVLAGWILGLALALIARQLVHGENTPAPQAQGTPPP